MRPRAFSLIELIVVIAIIATLIGIILPSLGASREASRRVKCLANLRSFGQAIAAYMNDSDTILPYVRPFHEPGGNVNDPSLLDIMSAYLSVDPPERERPGDSTSFYTRVADVFKCPSDLTGNDARTNFQPVWRSAGISYEYFAGAIMLGAEFATIPAAVSPKAVTLTYQQPEWRDLPVMMDNDDWHPGRAGATPRNALFYDGWRPDWAGPFVKLDVTTPRMQKLICDVTRFGGVPRPGCN